jgi:hypothetical protein
MRRGVTVTALALVVASMVSARAMFASPTPPAATPATNCTMSSSEARLPGRGTWYRAATAGLVVLTSRADGVLAVAAVVPSAGYRPIIDKSGGRAVQVYFGAGHRQVVFSVESSAGALEVRVTTCP